MNEDAGNSTELSVGIESLKAFLFVKIRPGY